MGSMAYWRQVEVIGGLMGLSWRADAAQRTTRAHAQLAVDAAAWALGLLAAVWTRYEGGLSPARIMAVALVAAVAATLHGTVGHSLYLYRGRYAFGSLDEVRAVALTVSVVAGSLTAADLAFTHRPVPASSPLVGGTLALVLMFAARLARRVQRERRLRPDAERTSSVLLFGAGSAAEQLVRSMLRDPKGRYLPVGLVDDDPAKRHLRLHGVPVLGRRSDLRAVVDRTGAGAVICSMANADAGLIREVRRLAADAGAAFKVLPSVSELLDGRVGVADVREPQIADLLGRHQVETDLDAIAQHLAGRRILVTGAGGSIGSELCRQLDRFGPAELMMLDYDDSALHAIQLSLRGRAMLDSPDLILADLRDADTIHHVMRTRRPQVVFHAAALKHLTLLERHPAEAVKTNIWGTANLLDAARDVDRFVNLSTDKAANPTSVLGYSKRITEQLTAHAAATHSGTFLSVRFGNVLGSRGSALPAFIAQAASGGPITVTHPDVTRYFMTVQEAVQLVIQAAVIGRDGEALVLEMGTQVRIADVAQQVARQSSPPVDIVYTGLRDGEKLHEELFGDGEHDLRPLHPLISHVRIAAIDPTEVRDLSPMADPAHLRASLARVCERNSVVGVAMV
jgi:FlaA1/EpsC-like NDP-sugar epimerase